MPVIHFAVVHPGSGLVGLADDDAGLNPCSA